MLSESAFLAWKIRCEKRIEHEEDPEWKLSTRQVKRLWFHAINTRIAQDRLLTNRQKYKKKALKLDTVLETWEGLIELEEELTIDTLRRPGVLVGTGTARHTRGEG